MLIDWFTVGAQVVNFLILVWLLKRFLYKPILNTIDSREKRIAAELADAYTKKIEAQKEFDEFQYKNEEFDKQRAALLSQATDEAKAERQRLLNEAREAADALSAQRQETLKIDARNLSKAISRRDPAGSICNRAKDADDLATTSLEERLAEVFTAGCGKWTTRRKSTLQKPLRQHLPPRSCAARLSCLRSNARRYRMRSTKPSQLKSTSGSRLRRT